MGVYGGPNSVASGLVLELDAGNSKGFDAYENLLTYSEQFDNAAWSKSNASVTANSSIAPDGTLSADTITATVNDDVIVNQTYTSSYNSTPLTYSIFAKAGTYRYIAIQSFINIWSKTVVFDLQTGTVVTPFYPNDGRTWNIVAYPNGWYRCIVTYPANYYYYYYFQFGLTNYAGPADGGVSSATSPAVGEYIYVWGAQLETGSTASTYYPTTGTAKTRGSTLIDLSGGGNTGTLTNGPTYSSSNGGSIVFDGVDDYVNAGNLGSFYSQGTISYWMNSSAVENYRNPFSTHYLGGNVGIRFEQYSSTSPYGGFNVLVGNDAGTYVLYDYSPGAILTANIWYNVVLVWNTSTNNVVGYLNSSQKFNSTHTLWATTLPSISIGSGFDASRYFKGNISNTQIYNRALTAAEISQNYNALRSRYGL